MRDNNSSRKSKLNIDGYTPRSVQRVLARSKQTLVRLRDIEGYLEDMAKVMDINSDDAEMVKQTLAHIREAQEPIETLYTRFANKQTILTGRLLLSNTKTAKKGKQS